MERLPFKLYLGMVFYWKMSFSTATEKEKRYHTLCNEAYHTVLFSYFHLKDFEEWREFISYRSKEVNLMLDSGAFSIWKAGEGAINLPEYIKYCLKLQEEKIFKSLTCISLDKIPGTVNIAASQPQILEAADISLKNYLQMRDAGVKNVLPVYHLGEPLDCLKKLIDTGCDYIGLGGLARAVGDKKKSNWLDSVFTFFRKYNCPDMKTHGFGITSSPLLLKYPFHSVDSSSLMIAIGFGYMDLFDEKHGKIRRPYMQEIRSYKKGVDEAEKDLLAKRFGVPFDDLLLLWCRRYFSLLEWLKYEKYIIKNRQVKPVLQQSILGDE